MKILVAGYPYIREYYLKTFDQYPEKDQLFFLLPKKWKAKRGQVIFNPPSRDNILTTKAYFYHSNYPILGGLLKGWMPALPLYIHRVFKKEKGILYSPSEPILLTTLYQGIWAKIFGLKHIIFTWENIDYKDKFRGINWFIKKSILRLNLFFCDGVICGNEKAKKIFTKLTSKSLEVIPLSGVDTHFFKPCESDFRKKYNLESKIIFTFVGALGYRKGIHLILEAFGNVLKEINNAHLIVIGSGESEDYENKLEETIKNFSLQNYITRMRWAEHKDLVEILSASDVFLYPSISYKGWEEQFGYSIAEAGLMKLPVISTKSGSIAEIIKDGETGILIEQNSTRELSAAMVALGKDREMRIKLGENARSYISERYANDLIADKFLEFFRSIYEKNNTNITKKILS